MVGWKEKENDTARDVQPANHQEQKVVKEKKIKNKTPCPWRSRDPWYLLQVYIFFYSPFFLP